VSVPDIQIERSTSVVIATRDRSDSLEATLRFVERLAVPPGWTTELIIVDNGSSGETRIKTAGNLNGRPGRVVYEDIPGVSRARNRGASLANGEVLLFLDDDVRPPTNWLSCLASPILEGTAAATVSQFRLGHDRPWLTAIDRARLMSELSIEPAHPFLVGGSMAIRRDLFTSLGGFEEELGPGALGPGGEDLLLTYRVQAAQERICLIADVEVLHLPEERKLERQALDRRVVAEARSDAWLAYHWFGRTDRFPRVKEILIGVLARLGLGRTRVTLAARSAWHRQMNIEQRTARKYPERSRSGTSSN